MKKVAEVAAGLGIKEELKIWDHEPRRERRWNENLSGMAAMRPNMANFQT
ncbi:hypothetical protein [Singulisphaera sp. GP187]|nr:hypothetical protein [Singulisphaera sp. GP187]